MVEIKAGLTEGELVVLNPPSSGSNVDSFRQSADNDPVKPAESQTVASSGRSRLSTN